MVVNGLKRDGKIKGNFNNMEICLRIKINYNDYY